MTETAAVVDASVLVDLLVSARRRTLIRTRLQTLELHAPAHIDAEVLSALARLNRAGDVEADDVTASLDRLRTMSLRRHLTHDLLDPAWHYRQDVRLTDALYVALAERLGVGLITADVRLARTGSVKNVHIETV